MITAIMIISFIAKLVLLIIQNILTTLNNIHNTDNTNNTNNTNKTNNNNNPNDNAQNSTIMIKLITNIVTPVIRIIAIMGKNEALSRSLPTSPTPTATVGPVGPCLKERLKKGPPYKRKGVSGCTNPNGSNDHGVLSSTMVCLRQGSLREELVKQYDADRLWLGGVRLADWMSVWVCNGSKNHDGTFNSLRLQRLLQLFTALIDNYN